MHFHRHEPPGTPSGLTDARRSVKRFLEFFTTALDALGREEGAKLADRLRTGGTVIVAGFCDTGHSLTGSRRIVVPFAQSRVESASGVCRTDAALLRKTD